MPDQHSDNTNTTLPSITMPKGGGAIQGMGEKFQVNAVNGTASFSIPIPASPGRNGFAPQLALSYDSGSGNSVFGLGWNVTIPSITRKTSRGIPQYQDEDVFLLSDAEDLVPVLENASGKWKPQTGSEGDYSIVYYRPRTEGLFARIEQLTHNSTGFIYWRVTTKENITHIYGQSATAVISHPQDAARIFQWLLEKSYNAKGDIMVYEYQQENSTGIDGTLPFEQNRLQQGLAFANRHIKYIRYGNVTSGNSGSFHFHIAFDYGDHDTANTTLTPNSSWPCRNDPFSTCRSGFEIRTWRLCRRILLFHDFPAEGIHQQLVKAVQLEYDEQAAASLLTAAAYTGYKKKADGTTASKSFPPLRFTYSASTPGSEIQSPPGTAFTDLFNGTDIEKYEWLDYYGEGLPGLLVEQNNHWLYKPNAGNGNFDAALVVGEKPGVTTNGNARPLFGDIDGDGAYELLLRSDTLNGYYKQSNGAWENFNSFNASALIDFNNPNLRFADLDGDGLADILIAEDDVFRFYLSKRTEGFEAPGYTRKAADEANGPAVLFSNREETVLLADMNGDGLADIVRIRNGSVAYWPNMGYGHFGARVEMDAAPWFEETARFDPARIRTADIDGSGTTDILYLKNNSVTYWLNQNGNSFAAAAQINNLPFSDNHSYIAVHDILGRGTACLVWSSPISGSEKMKFHYIDLFSGVKPRLLTGINNNMGHETLIEYTASTEFYLEDKQNNRSWITKLPFPVMVIKKTTSIDHISNAQLVSSYKYHHGYYDGEEREFRGFGMVEQTDAESFNTFSPAAETDQPPVYTKTWFHTGIYKNSSAISSQYKTEYYNGDAAAYNMPGSFIEGDAQLDYTAMREACRALKGRMLRQEIYSTDGTGKQDIPYQVMENNYTLRQLQPAADNRFGVYLAAGRESITYNYERNVNDPRCTHAFVLEIDAYGFTLKTASIVYPRRSTAADLYPEQQVLYATAATNTFIHNTSTFYLLGAPLQTKTLEINGLSTGAAGYIGFNDLQTALSGVFDDANILLHHANFSTGVQARLMGSTKYLYSNGALPLAAGIITAQALLFKTRQLVMSEAWVTQVYTTKVDSAIMLEAGYELTDACWWKSSPQTTYHDTTGFYLPFKTTDAFGKENSINYDTYFLMPVQQTDAIGNTSSATPNYQSLSYSSVTDINENTAGILTDALGMVMVTTNYGTVNGALKGDNPVTAYTEQEPAVLADILSNPQLYLQGATTYFWYNLQAWQTGGEAPHFISLARETHVSDLTSGTETAVQIMLGYSDGFGRELQTKLKVDDGPLISGGATVERWLVSGRKVYNNKQKPIKQYEPFYSGTYLYEAEAAVAAVGATPIIYYDPLGRAIKTETPKGFYTKVEFNPWQVSTYDENDTVTDSVYYLLHYTESGDEAAALAKAAVHANTPTTTVLDSLGRAFIKKQLKTAAGTALITYTSFDIQGNILTLTDPRQYESNKSRPATTQVSNFTWQYDLLNTQLHTISADAGESWALNNIMGKPIYGWNARNYRSKTEYDSLWRPVKITVDGNGLNNVVQLMVYGETAAGAADKNLKGQVYQQYDEAGMVENTLFDFKGALITSSRRLRTAYKTETNWTDTTAEALETETFTIANTYDALGRVVQMQKPDGSITTNVFHQAGWLKAVTVQLKNETAATPFISSIEYNAKGQRTKLVNGGGVQTAYTYENETFRLTALTTTRQETSGSITTLQDIAYVYDPVGNIVKITDHSFETVFTANQAVEPVCEYTYDALYQMVQAGGREHKALTKTNYQQSAADYKNNHFANLNDAAQLANYTENYTYDNSGNLTAIQHTGYNSYTRTMTVSENSNRAITDEMNGTSDVDSYFDAAGNMIQLEHLQGITWNYRNNIASVTIIERNSENDAEYYVYDGAGTRLRKIKETYNSSGTRLRKEEKIYAGGIEIKRIQEGSAETLIDERYTNHIMDGSNRLAIAYYFTISSASSTPANTNIIRYQFGNHLGSASMETDNTGAVISYEEYLPYGGTAFTTGISTTEVNMKEYRYTGKERDDTTGLYYYGARYYATWMGRWLSCDPAGIKGGINLFMFSNNSPVVFIDPTGYAPESHIKGEVGELILGSMLEEKGYIVFTDWEKIVTAPGIDLVAYDPKSEKIMLFDNKAYSGSIREVSAFSPTRLGPNTAEVRAFLEKNAGGAYVDEALRSLDAGNFDLVVSNVNSTQGVSFSQQIFDRYGYKAFDARTGNIYDSYAGWSRHLAPLLERIEKAGLSNTKIVMRGSDMITTVARMGPSILKSAKLKTLGKGIVKSITLVGIGAGLASSAQAAEQGDYVRATAEAVGTVVDPVDWALLVYDYNNPSDYPSDLDHLQKVECGLLCHDIPGMYQGWAYDRYFEQMQYLSQIAVPAPSEAEASPIPPACPNCHY